MHEKCLSREAKDLLLWVAQNGAFLSDAQHEEFKTVCQLVDSGHLFHGLSINNDSPTGAAYYSITKKGFTALQCNFLWDVYDEDKAHPHVVAHVNESRLECHQQCLHESKTNSGEPIKIFRKTSKESQ